MRSSAKSVRSAVNLRGARRRIANARSDAAISNGENLPSAGRVGTSGDTILIVRVALRELYLEHSNREIRKPREPRFSFCDRVSATRCRAREVNYSSDTDDRRATVASPIIPRVYSHRDTFPTGSRAAKRLVRNVIRHRTTSFGAVPLARLADPHSLSPSLGLERAAVFDGNSAREFM